MRGDGEHGRGVARPRIACDSTLWLTCAPAALEASLDEVPAIEKAAPRQGHRRRHHRRRAGDRDQDRKARQARGLVSRALAEQRPLRPEEGFFEIGKGKSVARADGQHGQDLRADAEDDGALEGAGARPATSPRSETPTTSRRTGARRCSTSRASPDMVMDDIEAMFSVEGVSREQLRYIPDEHGGAVAGELIVNDTGPRDRARSSASTARSSARARTRSRPSSSTSRSRRRRSSSSASRPAACSSACRATSSGRSRDCILISMAGVPTRATRRFVRRLSDQCKIPVYAVRRLRPLRDLEHLPHAEGRLGERGPHQPLLLRPAGVVPRRDAAGHHRLQAPDAPAQGRRTSSARRTR